MHPSFAPHSFLLAFTQAVPSSPCLFFAKSLHSQHHAYIHFQLKVYHGGEKLVDRLDFEELALKSIDPSLGPSLSRLSKGQGPAVDGKDHDADGVLKVRSRSPLLLPFTQTIHTSIRIHRSRSSIPLLSQGWLYHPQRFSPDFEHTPNTAYHVTNAGLFFGWFWPHLLLRL